MTTPKIIKLAAIRLDGGTQMRSAMDGEAIEDYSAAMLAGATFPPVVLFHDGKDYWPGDGHHRIEAAIKAKLAGIPADVRPGTVRDARRWSCGANGDHGIRRTNDDKRNAVRSRLDDPEDSKLSDRDIAKICRVSQPFVSKERKAKGDNVITLRGVGGADALPPFPGEGETVECLGCTWGTLPSGGALTGRSANDWTAFIRPAQEDGRFYVLVMDQNWYRDTEDPGYIETTVTKWPIPPGAIPATLESMGFDREAASWQPVPVRDGKDFDEGLDLFHRWSWPHWLFDTKAEWLEKRVEYAP